MVPSVFGQLFSWIHRPNTMLFWARCSHRISSIEVGKRSFSIVRALMVCPWNPLIRKEPGTKRLERWRHLRGRNVARLSTTGRYLSYRLAEKVYRLLDPVFFPLSKSPSSVLLINDMCFGTCSCTILLTFCAHRSAVRFMPGTTNDGCHAGQCTSLATWHSFRWICLEGSGGWSSSRRRKCTASGAA